jgi:hypothetical protein
MGAAGGRGLHGRVRRAVEQERLVGSETVRDPAFLQIIRRHFDSHAISGQDVHPIDAHASGQVAVELVILRLGAEDFDSERGIWKGFQDQSDELDNIL